MAKRGLGLDPQRLAEKGLGAIWKCMKLAEAYVHPHKILNKERTYSEHSDDVSGLFPVNVWVKTIREVLGLPELWQLLL